ncbi:MAG: hypothetical protein F6K19_40135 [Cyanothece sp. SIO1E1]|nr:hypothetical protein [Cyanothece sp. SIO1E1]
MESVKSVAPKQHLSVCDLRIRAYWEWAFYNYSMNAYTGVPFEPDNSSNLASLAFSNDYFKDCMRQEFGDLRKRSTWESAVIKYSALVLLLHLLTHRTGVTTTAPYAGLTG